MKLEGAEATVIIDGEKVVKERKQKNYRHPEIDERIRKERTSKEKRIIKEARSAGVNVPSVEELDATTLEFSRVDGELFRETIQDRPEITEELGRNVAFLHGADIIHGDLTTSNIIVKESETVLIDFGLSQRSQRIEERAVDIHLFKQVLESSHPDVTEEAWNHFLEVYLNYGKSEEVLERLEDVEKRGRYK